MTDIRRIFAWISLVLLLSLVLGACAPLFGTPAPEVSQPIYRWGEVADRLWVLVAYGDALNPTLVEEGTVITAVFSSVEPEVSGSGGCNSYFAAYTSDDQGNLTIDGPIGTTMMVCEEGGEQEMAYLAALETVTGYTISEQGRLELTYDTGQPYEEKLVYIPGETALVGTIWRLVSYGAPDDLQAVIDGTEVTAVFSPETDLTGTVAGNATCNSYTASYTLDDDRIAIGPVAGTMMICPDGAEQEAAYLAALGAAQTFQIAGPNMQITYDGGVLNFTSLNLPLENILWQAEMILSEPVPTGTDITLLFTPGDTEGKGVMSGNDGCNNFQSNYETSDQELKFTGKMSSSAAQCPGRSLGQGQRTLLDLLKTTESYEIRGNRLVLQTEEGDILLAANREPLVGTLWTLISLGDIKKPQPPVEGSRFTATFTRLPSLPTGTVQGETGCNTYNATFTANLNEIKINLPVTTQNEDCPWGVGNFEVEQQFFLGLNSATEYKILGDILQIPYGEGKNRQALNFVATPPQVEEVLDLTPLHGTSWVLAAIGDAPVLAGSQTTAQFAIEAGGVSGTISGSGGCNEYNAAIGENFVVGPIASTQKACEQAVMDQETAYFASLQTAYGYSLAGSQLLIPTANGILTFAAPPPPEQPVPPTAVISGPELGDNSQPMAFDGSQSTPGTSAIVAYDWDMGDGTQLSGATVQHTYATPGGYEVRLTVTDQAGLTGTASKLIQVSAVVVASPPTAVIVGPDLGDNNQVLTFDGSQSAAGSAPIAAYDWDMGDGVRLSGAIITYVYTVPGTFEVRLTVTDQAGLSNTATQVIQISPTVEARPPVAVIAGPGSASAGEPVTFSAANSQQGSAAITSYRWQSGDGLDTGQVSDNSFTHSYARAGVYYPSVTVVDATGLADTASIEVVISAPLVGTAWVLDGTQITLQLRAADPATGLSPLGGFAGCNDYNANYTTTLAAGPTNAISIGPITATGRACDDAVMQQEQAYLASLQAATSYTISGSTLTLATPSGTLRFSAAVATPAATQ